MTIGFLGINSKSVSYSILFEKIGHECLLFDQSEDLVYNINNQVFLSEESQIQMNLVESKNISGSTEITEIVSKSEVIFSFFDCPSNSDNTIDISEIIESLQQFYFCSHLDISLFDKIFVLSTVLNPGDSKVIYEKISQFGLHFCYMPNFLTEGQILSSIRNNKFSVLGTNSWDASEIIISLMRQIRNHNSDILVMSPESAEFVKLAISSIVANKIVVSNLIGDLMTSKGLEKEISIVLSAISKDERIGKENLSYGLGYGGPHLGKEIRALSKYVEISKVENNIFEELEQANQEHLMYIKYYYMSLNPNKSNPFVIDGLGYKRNMKNLEDSQRFKLCVELLNQGYIVNVIESMDTAIKLQKLADSYENKLKFFKKGTNPDGVKINL